MPLDLGEILNRFEKILIPELNLGQLQLLYKRSSSVKPLAYKVQGRPFTVAELVSKIQELL